MTIITTSLQFLFKLLLFIFVPILFIVTIVWVKLSNYAKKNKSDPHYDEHINFYSYLTSIIITLALLIVNTCFSVYFTHSMRIEDLVKGNEVIYYCILVSPSVPLLCFLYYTVNLCKIVAKEKKSKEEEIVEIEIL